MKLSVTMAVLACLALGAPAAQAYTLDAAFTTTAPSDDSCNPGPHSSSFLTKDAEVWVYVSVSNAAAGDQLRVDWVRPGAAVYATSNFDPLPSSGGWCFDASISIAGHSAVLYPGTWTVKGYWNGTAMFAVNFTLSATTGSGGGVN